jgi:hypothetical protein
MQDLVENALTTLEEVFRIDGALMVRIPNERVQSKSLEPQKSFMNNVLILIVMAWKTFGADCLLFRQEKQIQTRIMKKGLRTPFPFSFVWAIISDCPS